MQIYSSKSIKYSSVSHSGQPFTYWISLFEANYGDITEFYNNLQASNNEKLITINNLLIDLIEKSAILPKNTNNN